TVSRISIVVATTSPDIKADGIVAALNEPDRRDMELVGEQVLPASDTESVSRIQQLLTSLSGSRRCALVLVGHPEDTGKRAHEFLEQHADLVVLQVTIVGDIVHIGIRDPRLEALLNIVRDLVKRVGNWSKERTARFRLEEDRPEIPSTADDLTPAIERPVLQAAIHWVHTVLREAVERVSIDDRDLHGLSLTRATILQNLDQAPANLHADPAADAAPDEARAAADPYAEPLAAAACVFKLTPIEFRLMVLTLAPEFDVRYQQCIGFLLDDMSRRTGTIGLYCSLLGVA